MQTEYVEGFRLSPQQERLWWLQGGGAGTPYRAQCVLRVEGGVERDALLAALRAAFERHEILRTNFRSLHGLSVPVQVISEASAPAPREYDLTGLAAAEQEDKLDELAREARRLPLHFEHGPPADVVLVRLAPESLALVITLPSMCADAEGLRNLARELGLHYAAAFGGGEPAPDPMQYADYAAWQHELLESEETRAGRDYWRRKEVKGLSSLGLPFERGAAAKSDFETRSLAVELSASTLAGIEAAALKFEGPASDFLLACWHVLLWRLTGHSPSVVGASLDGRKYEEFRDALGLFSRYLPTTCDMEDRTAFGEVLSRVGDETRGAHKWQEYFSWEQVEAAGGAEGEGAFFPFVFEFENARPFEFAAAGATFSLAGQYALFDRFKVKLSCARRGEGLALEFHYDANLLAEDDVRRVAASYVALVNDALTNFESTVAGLKILDDAERQKLLSGVNRTARDYGGDVCLHELFERQAARTPDATALVSEEESLTYAELDERSSRLALRLRALGIRPGQFVGVCLERSAGMVVGLLGVLKAGAAYVPLDPDYPAGRLAFMLEDTRVPVIVTRRSLSDVLPEVSARVLYLDDPGDDEGAAAGGLGAGSESNGEAARVSPDYPAYVIYTSGSTGRPKGVVVSHRSINNRILWTLDAFPLGPDDRLLQKTVFSFDASIWEIFAPLFSGAQLVMARPGGHQDSAYLVRAVVEHSVTVLQLVPSMLRVMLEEPSFKECRTLRRMFCGGEVLPREVVERFHSLLDAELINLYGPTEVSIDATYWECARGEEGRVPIGRPIGNMEVYVLDAGMEPVPEGVAGELYVGGVGLAFGYLNQPVLTAERFVPDPHGGRVGGRLYRTGDVGRRRADGSIEYVGRADSQVKIRGYRIEPGETEAMLKGHEWVREAAVVVRDDKGGGAEQRLVAYVVVDEAAWERVGAEAGSENGARAEAEGQVWEALRGYLRERLPEQMVPTGYVSIERMPLLPNGKLDKSSLPEPESLRRASASGAAPARTPAEELIAGIWCEVLGLERVGVGEDFFALGGHSLLATQVMSRVRAALGAEVPLRRLFESPTVASLAASAEAALREGTKPPPPIVPASREGELPLSFAQERLWFLQQLEPRSSAYNLFTGIRLEGQLNVAALEEALNGMVLRHQILRTTFPAVEGRPVQVVAPALALPLPLTDLSAMPEEEREAAVVRLATEERQRPFDLSRGPLLRASLLRLADEELVLLLTMHHIISDGWSGTVLVREIVALYEAACRGEAPPLAELSIQYADYAVWQREWLQGEVLEAQLSYWRGQLKGAPATLELPTDRPRPSVQTFNGAVHPFAFPKDLSDSLRQLSRREGVTLYMMLLSAFKVLLSRYSGQADVVVGGDIANRTQIETEGLIGFFVNMLVLRTDLSGDPSFRELLGRVRETTLGAYAHQDMPFEKLVEELHVERELSRNPLFQVLFTWQDAVRERLEIPGLRLSHVPAEGRPAKFDLTLALRETDEGLSGVFECNADLFEDATIERMAEHFGILLRGIVADPEQRLSGLPLLGEDERRLLLVDWNETRREAEGPGRCFHEMFEARAAAEPGRVAVVGGGASVTYGELNARANQLAHRLKAFGVGPDVLVGIYLTRSVEMMVGLLGVLKAGGAYVPLDPGHPLERLAFLLEDTKAPVVLTVEGLVDNLPAHWGQVVCLDSDWETMAGESEENPEGGATAESLAYIIYTSGSTGKPKGVMVHHGGLANYLSWCADAYRVEEGDGAPVHSPLGFDLSVTGIFSPLVAGRSVVLLPEEEAGESLREALQGGGAFSLVKLTPAHLAVLNRRLTPGEVAGRVKALVVGGEALTAEHLSFWREHSPDTRIINEYGPTETVVGCCVYEVPPTADGLRGDIPIGRPIANTRLYVLDAHLRPTPLGVAGELYVGGAGVARGYLNQPALTAERFVPDPFAERGGERLYKTGDRARYLPDGNLEFLGRLDEQLKVRGFRIEPGEVEAELLGHQSVKEAAVMAREDQAGDKRLVAYVVAREGQACSPQELRAHLKERLPEYMVPSAFVALEELPLTPNGKLDRRALPAPDGSRPDAEEAYVAPRNEVEEVLAEIWAEVLSVERLGIHDNFFALGGHSLLATQLLARLLNLFRVEIPLLALFQSPTVAEFAGVLVEHEARPGQAEKISRAILKVKRMSAEDKRAMLDEKRQLVTGEA